MKSPKFWLRQIYGELRIARRRKELEHEISRSLRRELHLSRYGNGRNDSIYLASNGAEKVAVLRVLNPAKKGFLNWTWVAKKRKNRASGSVKASVMGASSLNREWDLLMRLSDSGITPRPLWRTQDATAVAYLPGKRLRDLLTQKPPEAWWIWIDLTFAALNRLHRYGVAHNDANASNTLVNEPAGEVFFIDLDCGPKKMVLIEQQQILDYLKIVASILQIAPSIVRRDGKAWADAVGPHVPENLRIVGIDNVLERKTLRHLRRNLAVRKEFSSIFRCLE